MRTSPSQWQVASSSHLSVPNAKFFVLPAYPDGHPDSTDPEDVQLDYLKAKVDAGADYIMTQLFYDVDGFLEWEKKVRQKGILRIQSGYPPVVLTLTLRRDHCPHCSQHYAHPNICVVSTSY